jgi:hypothetical protein
VTDRFWADGENGGTPITAAALNGIETDITAVEQAVVLKEPLLPAGTATQFLRGDREWVDIDLSGGGGGSNTDPLARESLMDPENVWGPDGTKLTIPTHVEPAGGQVVHPSVVFVPEGWGVNGYKYWLAITAYPAGNDDHEDPNVLASHDGITWVVPPGLTNPIADADGQPEYYSDPYLALGPNNTMYLFFRWYAGVPGGGQEEKLFFSTSTDGVIWTTPQAFLINNETVRRLLSPSLIFEDDRWTLYAVDIVPAVNTVVRLRSDSSDPMSAWSAPETCNPGTLIANREPWHLYVIKTGGRYYGLLNDVILGGGTGGAGDLMFLSSGDGLNFTNSAAATIPKAVAGKHDQLYQSALVPAIEGGRAGFRVWYTGYVSDNTWWLFRTFISEGRWKALTLANAWVNYTGSGGYAQTGLRYKKEGRSATLDGAVKSGALSTMICQLPVEAQPYHTCMYWVNSAGSNGMIIIQGKINTSVAGQVTYFAGPAAPSYMPIHIKYDLD